jgi:hypothetical protein
MINGNNMYIQTAGMNIRKDNDDWRRAVDTVDAAETAILTEKTITENGTYTAAEDNADGYSEVTVDVNSGFSSIRIPVLPEKVTQGYPKANVESNLINPKGLTIYTSKTGEYQISSMDGYVFCVNPVVSVTGFGEGTYDYYCVFTPAENYQGLYDAYGYKITFTGDSIVAGDGKVYIAYVRYFTETYGAAFTIKRYDRNFYTIIT